MNEKYTKWYHCNVYDTAEIGEGTRIGSYVEIGDGVKIGKNCIISSYVFTCKGVEIEDNCFIGPRVTFTNDKKPPSYGKEWDTIIVRKGAVIGAGAILLPGIEIGEGAMVGAGAVVTKSVPAGEVWVGNPAKKKLKNDCPLGLDECVHCGYCEI